MAKKQEKKVEMTRAQKTEATKGIIKEVLSVKPMKHNELIEETAKLYTERYKSEETENVNDVKGRVGSVLDIMKKESEVMYEGGMYALKARMPVPAPVETVEEKPVKKPAKTKAKKAEESKKEEVKTEQAAPKKKKASKKKEEVKVEEVAPAQEVKEETAPAKEEKAEEKPAPKKRGRKPKVKAEAPAVEEEQKTEETPVLASVEAPKSEEKAEEIASFVEPIQEEQKAEVKVEEPKKEEPKEEKALTVKPKGEVAQKGVVMDMSFLIGNVKNKPAKTDNKPQRNEEPKIPAKEEKKAPMSEVKEEKTQPTEEKKQPKVTEKPAQKPASKEGNKPSPKVEEKPAVKQPQKQDKPKQKQPERQLSSDEKLREAYLKRIRSLGGDYFEYYSVYLLERYSMRNGRRLEMLKISGGDRDGGIDGEIELTDKFGFKETIYIQSKNWDPDKGKEEYWVVGETLLQQFIGACACKQAKDGKQHCRGIFVTTSRFTPDAKRILEDMSDKIVGYDGNDLYETAKECEFGLIKKNGEWALDEKLLSGVKDFFNMF